MSKEGTPHHTGRTPTTEQVERQLQTIRDEVSAVPLLSPPEVLSLTCKVAKDFQNDDAYYSQVLSLFNDGASNEHYKFIRYARRDGNCFFRCASFRLFELILRDKEYASVCCEEFQRIARNMKAMFGEFSSDFSDVVKEVTDAILDGKLQSAEDIYAEVISDKASYIIVFFRYAVSTYLRAHTEEFIPFVLGMDYGTVEGYCTAEVEPVDHESDNIQLVAFAKLFNLAVVVETLDRTTSGTRTTHRINVDEQQTTAGTPQHRLYLLFRPGHYDLLEKK